MASGFLKGSTIRDAQSRSPTFTHLHVHSNFSFLDGASSPEALVETAANLGMMTLALTDHHGLYGVVRFHKAAKKAGVKPIIGAEICISREHLRDEEMQRSNGQSPTAIMPSSKEKKQHSSTLPFGRYHLVLLAKTRRGYANLCQIVSRALLSHQDDPHIGLDEIVSVLDPGMKEHAALQSDLFAIIPHRCGEISYHLLGNRPDYALLALRRYVAVFGRGNVFLELQDHLLPSDKWLNDQLYSLGRRAGVSCVASNNVHYATEEGYRLQDLMVCIKHGITVDSHHPERRLNSQYYLKPAAEMVQLFKSYPGAIGAANYIASRCEVDLSVSACRPPRFPVPAGETPFSVLYHLCQEQLPRRYQPVTSIAVKQLARELTVIDKLDLAEFFLCVWDICRFARQQGIRYAGRGSAANSIVAYVLGITTVDPIEHNLLFERFLHEELVDRMPDIDIDFDSARREEVIKYVEEKYTERHSAMVANVITYRTRLAVRETAKALGFPMHLVDRLSDAAYNLSPHNIEDYLGQVEGQISADALRQMVELAEELKGCPRHLSLHNGGVLITRDPLTTVVPVEVSTNGVRVCQFNKDDVEAMGLIKFDLLGLRNFTIIDETVELIRQSRGIDLDIDALSYDDEATYDMLCSSETIGVFQLESPGQWNLLSRTQPRVFKDLVIEVALFRPGPLQGQMVNPYVARRQGKEPVSYLHPCLEPILSDTLGIILFQEQVLEIAHVYAGLSYAEADGFRRAISHYRTVSEMEGMRAIFYQGAERLGRPPEITQQLFELLSAYTGYGFCRSHAAAFARTVYQTAYLKTHYPAEFLAAVLSNEPCDFFPAHVVLDEAKRLGIVIKPVDVNKSLARFSVEDRGRSIRIGLMQVEGLGEDSAKRVVEVRGDKPFGSLEDFYRRTDLSRDAIANLIRVGAFDSVCPQRRKLLWQLDEVAKSLGSRGLRHKPELSLEVSVIPMSSVPELPELTCLEEATTDFELQGMSACHHPMQFYRAHLQQWGILSIAELRQAAGTVRVAGIVVTRQRPPTAKGMVFIVISDETGTTQVAVQPRVFDKYRPLLAQSRALIVAGHVHNSGNMVSMQASHFWPLISHATCPWDGPISRPAPPRTRC